MASVGDRSFARVQWLLRIFVDEGAPLRALLQELRPRLSDGAAHAYAGRLLDGLSNGPAEAPVVGNDPENFFVGSMTYDPIGDRVLIADNTADGRLYAVDALGNQQTVATEIAGVAGVARSSAGRYACSRRPTAGRATS